MTKIHTTIGIYPDGSFKVNGVDEKDLTSHIQYNQTFRFGRALMVDGKVIYSGYLSSKNLEEIINKNNLSSLKVNKITAPYV